MISLIILMTSLVYSDFTTEDQIDVNGDGCKEKIMVKYYQIKTITGLSTIKIFDKNGKLLFLSTPSTRYITNSWTFYKIAPDVEFSERKMIFILAPDQSGYWLVNVFRYTPAKKVFYPYETIYTSKKITIPTWKQTDSQDSYDKKIEKMQQEILNDAIEKVKNYDDNQYN